MISAFAPAKINLSLLVGKPIEFGAFKNYHPLNSLVAFAQNIGDTISIEPNTGFGFKIEGQFADGLQENENNLVVRAVHLMAEKFGKPLDITVILNKNLPIAAGIGGGSADAAATILALNDYWALGLSKPQLCEIGLKLGADIPVCIMGETVIMTSIGEVFEKPPKMPSEIAIMIANPLQDCSTQSVFGKFDQIGDFANIDGVDYRDCASLNELVTMLETMPNSLYRAAIEIVPQISQLKQSIEKTKGAKFATMSGSGASVFGLYDNIENAENAVAVLKSDYKNTIWAKAGILK